MSLYQLGHNSKNRNIKQLDSCSEINTIWVLYLHLMPSISESKPAYPQAQYRHRFISMFYTISGNKTTFWVGVIECRIIAWWTVDKDRSEWYHIVIVQSERYLDVDFRWCRQFISMGTHIQSYDMFRFITGSFIGLGWKNFHSFSFCLRWPYVFMT